MPAAFTLAQVSVCRVSIEFWSPYQRSSVLSPSVNSTMTFEYLKDGSIGGVVNGPPPTIDIHPSARPIAWLVLPPGVMPSTRVVIDVQLSESDVAACAHESYCSAANILAGVPATGAVTLVS